MTDSIQKKWQEYCLQISETARRFQESGTSPDDEITDALQQFIGSQAPATERELELKMDVGERLQENWRTRERAYSDSENHAAIKMPETTISEQASQARETPQENQACN